MSKERKGATTHTKDQGRVAIEGKGSGDATHKLAEFNNKVKTYITHNKGADWQLIRAPDVDLRGKNTNCFLEDSCSLHL